MKNSDGILAIQETLEVVEETIGETPLVTIIVAMEENNALRLTTTIGPVLSARTPILHSAKYAIAVKRLGLAVVEALVITEVAQTVVHNATAVGLTAVTTIVKRFTTITTGPARSVRIPILHSVKYAIAVKPHAQVVVVAVLVTDATAVAEMVAEADTVEGAETVTDVTAVAEMVAEADTVEDAETVTDATAVAEMVAEADTVEDAETVTDATAVETVVTLVAEADTVAETVTDATVVAEMVVVADTVAEMVTDATAVAEMVTDATVVAKMVTDAITVETVVILVTAIKTNDEATILTIARRRVSDQGMPTTESQTTSNQGSTTDTTTDER